VTELPRTTLAGDGIVLRPLRDSDADDTVAACTDPDIARFLPMIPVPYTRADALFWMHTIAESAWTGGGATFAIADPATDRLIGSVGLSEPRMGGRCASIGYWVAPWARRRGVATAASRTLADWAFSHGVLRLELITDLANEPSQRVAIGAGFQHEGIRRGGGRSAGSQLSDRVVWARLAGDSGVPPTRQLPDLPGGELSDGTVILRRIEPADARDVHALHTLPDVIARSVGTVPSLDDTRRQCEHAAYRWLAGIRAAVSIRDAATGTFAGDLGLFNLDGIGQGMIGYSMCPPWRGRGYASRAARLIADWAFTDVGLARLIAGVAPDNMASQRVLTRAGFQREGLQRSRLPGPGDGPRVDTVLFALLPDDRR
jgi:RimJ/RimL family protein N-acetyltransferase